MKFSVDGHIGRDRYRVEVRAGRHVFLADEAVAGGGQDEGPSPHELLAAALAGCTNITVRMYSDRKEWPLEAMDTHVVIEHGTSFDETLITRTIHFTGALTDEQRERLLQIAGRCPIHRTLAGSVTITTNQS